MSLEKIITQTADQPKMVIIWMHGLGADGNDFKPVVPQFKIPDLPLKFVFPHAPEIPVTINGSMVMRAWYDITMMDIQKHADKQGVLKSAQLIHELIAEQEAEGFKPEQIILAGFSQGGAMSLHVASTINKKLGGVIALSCYLPVPEVLTNSVHNNKDTPIFMAHGTEDPVVPYALGQASHQSLLKVGYRIDWYEYPLQHGVSLDEIMDIKQWIIKNFQT